MNQNATEEQITTLLRQGLSNAAIVRELCCDKNRVSRIRRKHGIPNVPLQPLTLEEKWATFTRPVDGGHLEWTGERKSISGTPAMRYREKTYTAAAIAFRIRHGRGPTGYAFAECGLHHCVAPDHVDDEPGRARTREQLRYLNGGRERKPYCPHGHDQAVHGRYQEDGRAYCEKCKRQRARSARQEVA
ncbi:hypothetical protein [Streptomyces cucumeris]|uniref:hypothetical protein n=1 Tax=Streptomyces cucumeris TaxID=2962890 RepID=UPI003D708E8E